MHISDDWTYTYCSKITLEQLPDFYQSIRFLSCRVDKTMPNTIEVVGHHDHLGLVVVSQYAEGATLLSPQELPGFEVHSVWSEDEDDLLEAQRAFEEGDFEDGAELVLMDDPTVPWMSEEKFACLRALSNIAFRAALEKAKVANLIRNADDS
ncbi:hypothetical protein G5V57_26980 [Nordella sp. HKS 07]|uniref:hypothetical protein n=1 Tax=Nordella sp. HKS 07 TaxID=2712222 RepID=UPI0013E13D88|nr:hypothetical protein [Nordella sp. HKS 07]QIG51050.1 hypothetical protein G5V57_26980 [Nordella sp. HKS 07]